MKKQILLVWTAIIVVLFSVGSIAAQGNKKMANGEMDMMAMMERSPQHALMMAHHHSAMAFATILRDTTADGKFADIEVARNAFAEIKHCMDQMEMVHRMQMSGMSKEMMDKMKPMMSDMKPKIAGEKNAINEQIAALERAFQLETPDAAEINKHSAELVMAFEKMMPMEKKMNMSGKNPM